MYRDIRVAGAATRRCGRLLQGWNPCALRPGTGVVVRQAGYGSPDWTAAAAAAAAAVPTGLLLGCQRSEYSSRETDTADRLRPAAQAFLSISFLPFFLPWTFESSSSGWTPPTEDVLYQALVLAVRSAGQAGRLPGSMSLGVAAPPRPVPPHEPRRHRRGPTGARATKHVYDPAHADPRVLALLGHGADSESSTHSQNGSSRQLRRRAARRPATAPARGAEREELERQKLLAPRQKKDAKVRWRGSIRATMMATRRFVAPGLGGGAPASTGPLSGARLKDVCRPCVFALQSVV